MNYTKAIEAETDAYLARLDAIGAHARAVLVVPFCDRKKLRFVAGMGTWCFYKANGGQAAPHAFDTTAQARRYFGARLWDFLTLPYGTGRQQDFGSMLADYTPPGWKDQRD